MIYEVQNQRGDCLWQGRNLEDIKNQIIYAHKNNGPIEEPDIHALVFYTDNGDEIFLRTIEVDSFLGTLRHHCDFKRYVDEDAGRE